MGERKTYTGMLTSLPKNGVFVYGANTDGVHGAGAARTATKFFGAVYGKVGYQGRSYGIVTKDLNSRVQPSISREEIVKQIGVLYSFAEVYHDLDFYVAYSGTGTNLNHYTNEEMASMFASFPIPKNVVFEESFSKLICQA